MKNMICLIFLLFISTSCIAQNFYISPLFGYGKYLSHRAVNVDYKPEIMELFKNTEDALFLRAGISGSYRLSILSVNTGIIYSKVVTDSTPGMWPASLKNLDVLQIPLGCDFVIGRKFYVFGGFGTYINFFHPEEESEYLQFPLCQFGLSANLGLGVRVSQKIAVDLKYQNEFGLTALYKTLYTHGFLESFYESNRHGSRILTLSLKYHLSSRKESIRSPRHHNDCIKDSRNHLL